MPISVQNKVENTKDTGDFPMIQCLKHELHKANELQPLNCTSAIPLRIKPGLAQYQHYFVCTLRAKHSTRGPILAPMK